MKYGTFYIDHINKHTQYEPPTVEDFQLGEQVRMKYLTQLNTIHRKSLPKSTTTINTTTTTTNTTNNHSIIKHGNHDNKSTPNNPDVDDEDDQSEFASSISSSSASASASTSSHMDGNGRVTPVTFCSDLKQLHGPLINTILVKSPRGFGFTIIGGSDCNRSAFLQVKL
ncbi:unnamed protein product [Schistosoma turkestanicum]|nr:unnamed protein product [Schistosoma turkestanicum]